MSAWSALDFANEVSDMTTLPSNFAVLFGISSSETLSSTSDHAPSILEEPCCPNVAPGVSWCWSPGVLKAFGLRPTMTKLCPSHEVHPLLASAPLT